MAVQSAVLGFPRQGSLRNLKKANEAYWGGKLSQSDLLAEGKRLRLAHWKIQKDAGVDIIPSNDFSYYDHVLDHAQLFGAIPPRYSQAKLDVVDEYFAMARGHQKGGVDLPSLEMVKWFDSNYHYMKPTFQDGQQFSLSKTPKPVAEYLEAKDAGIETRPVLLGPVTFLALGKADRGSSSEPISLLQSLLPVYIELLKALKSAGAQSVQIDESILVLDLKPEVKAAFKPAYEAIGALGSAGPQITVATYFGDIVHNTDVLPALNSVHGIHIDLVRNPEQLETVASKLGSNQTLSLGVVDGRNIWKNNFAKSQNIIAKAVQLVGKERIAIATSSSLLHTPHTLKNEKKLAEKDPEVYSWLAFAVEKCAEVAILAKATNSGAESVKAEFNSNAEAMKSRQTSPRTNDAQVKDRQSKVTEAMHLRKSPVAERLAAQKKHLNLPLFPTTTIGSFPQTSTIRQQRLKHNKGEITTEEYENFLKDEIKECVKIQEDLGLDVFVHGEPERTDMVEYFLAQMKGCTFTQLAWVQSFGSRCVKPPIIFGDVSRIEPMTVRWSKYAQSVSPKPMKGMLTGPITCLRWAFPRDDVHQSQQAQQLALAIRDEVTDLSEAGINVIQVDEPALREGLPLRTGEAREAYLKWAVNAFKLSTANVVNETQIHSHFCYSEFQDFFHAIEALDTDVLSIENSKSDAKLLKVFIDSSFPSEIGPGTYDIHSPRVPSEDEFKQRIAEMLAFLRPDQLWINPDCGLKTRTWDEVKGAISHMVAAAKHFRAQNKA